MWWRKVVVLPSTLFLVRQLVSCEILRSGDEPVMICYITCLEYIAETLWDRGIAIMLHSTYPDITSQWSGLSVRKLRFSWISNPHRNSTFFCFFSQCLYFSSPFCTFSHKAPSRTQIFRSSWNIFNFLRCICFSCRRLQHLFPTWVITLCVFWVFYFGLLLLWTDSLCLKSATKVMSKMLHHQKHTQVDKCQVFLWPLPLKLIHLPPLHLSSSVCLDVSSLFFRLSHMCLAKSGPHTKLNTKNTVNCSEVNTSPDICTQELNLWSQRNPGEAPTFKVSVTSLSERGKPLSCREEVREGKMGLCTDGNNRKTRICVCVSACVCERVCVCSCTCTSVRTSTSF